MIRRTVASTLIAATAVTALRCLRRRHPGVRGSDHGRDHGRVATYRLTGDPVDAANPAGSKFEGIGADERRGRFYVSEVTGGEIHRGRVGTAQTQEWIAGNGTDGRFTARGITVDRQGRVYIAGGPNGIGEGGVDNGRPDLWVYSKDGKLLAALQTPGQDVFLNDVAIGPDGAAYFTNSNDAQVFRVSDEAQRLGGRAVGRRRPTPSPARPASTSAASCSPPTAARSSSPRATSASCGASSLRTGKATLVRIR